MAKTFFENEVKVQFERYYLGLVEFAWRIIGCEETSRDIVQDMFVKLLESDVHLSDDGGNVKSYLYRMVKNSSLNHLRRQKVIGRYNQYLEDQPNYVEETILDSIIYAERLNQLHSAISTLPAACENICRLTFIEEKSNMEAAELTNTSINTVKTHKRKAVEALRRQLVTALKATKAILFL